MAEGIAIGRSFAAIKNYRVDDNKEMVAFGLMNLVGSFTSCYLTTGIFSRSAVNYNAGCKTAMSNIVMAIMVMITLVLLIPLFHYTPQVVLSTIIMSAMLGLIHYDEAIHLWHVDKYGFVVCMKAFFGAALKLAYSQRNPDHYKDAQRIPGYLIIEIDGDIYFANSNYLRERISRWIEDEEDRLKLLAEAGLQYVILDMRAVGNMIQMESPCSKRLRKSLKGEGYSWRW